MKLLPSFVMQNDNILVLVATEESATLCTNNDGASNLVARFFAPGYDMDLRRGKSAVPSDAAHPPSRALAQKIMEKLATVAVDGEYEGIVLIANAEMMRELYLAINRAVYDRIIATCVDTQQGPDFVPITVSLQHLPPGSTLQ